MLPGVTGDTGRGGIAPQRGGHMYRLYGVEYRLTPKSHKEYISIAATSELSAIERVSRGIRDQQGRPPFFIRATTCIENRAGWKIRQKR